MMVQDLIVTPTYASMVSKKLQDQESHQIWPRACACRQLASDIDAEYLLRTAQEQNVAHSDIYISRPTLEFMEVFRNPGEHLVLPSCSVKHGSMF